MNYQYNTYTPLLSIITVCYNSADTISKTIESVQKQNVQGYEHLIIDGKSTDKTIKIVEKICENDERIKLYSEKDSGIYDAMNKGLKRAKGKFVIFLNSGDYLVEAALSQMLPLLKKREDNTVIIYGDSINYYVDNDKVIKKRKKSNGNITLKSLKGGMGVVHQSIFASKKVFEVVGNFNTIYSIGADWDWLIRSVSKDIDLQYYPIDIVEFSTDGVSSKVHNWQRHLIRKKNYMYRVIDFNLFVDIMAPSNLIKTFLGVQTFQKLRLFKNKMFIRK